MKPIAVLLSLAVYNCVAVLLLYQWHSRAHWARLDLFSAFYLVISSTLAVQQILFSRRLSESAAVKDVFFARQIQPAWNKFTGVLGVLELGVFFDYGHVHTGRRLELVWLQLAGLIIYLISFVWLLWVDAYLLKNFVPKLQSNAPMLDGPYALVRHPRYTGLVGTRLAFPLLLPSVLSWLLAFCWFVLIRQRMQLEEEYLTRVYGPEYETYLAQTPRLFPLWR